MTVTATNSYSGPYLGTGAQTAFPYTFKALSADEVGVLVDGATQSSGYTVTLGTDGNGGTVTFDTAPDNGAQIIPVSIPSFEQDIAFTDAGPFSAATHDIANDRADIRDIYLKGLMDRAIKVPVGDTATNLELPPVSERGSGFLGFDVNGNIEVGSLTVTTAAGSNVSSRALLAAIVAPTNGQIAFFDGDQWKFDSSNLSTQVGYDLSQGRYVAPSTDTSGASGAWVRQTDHTDPMHFQAAGDGVTDDTIAFFRMAVLISLGYAPKYVRIRGGYSIGSYGTYLISNLIWRNYFPAGALRTEVEGFNSFVVPTDSSTAGPYFVGIDGLTIEGVGKPIIKRKDAGCQTTNTLSTGGALFNFKRCSKIRVFGCEFDGNRLGQTHTSGFASGPINYCMMFLPDCDDVDIRHNVLGNSGTLVTSGDKAGDDILFWSGGHNITVEHVRFHDSGRWGITVERPEPRFTDNATTRTRYAKILHCHFDNPFEQDGGVQLGAIDVEPWAEIGYVEIGHCHFKGSSKVAIGSAPNSASQTVRGVHVHDLYYDMTGSVAPHVPDNQLNVFGAWTQAQGGAAVRRYENLRIENISVVSDKALAAAIVRVNACIMSGGAIRGIQYAGPAAAGTVSAIEFASAFLEGDILIAENDFTGLIHGVLFSSWNDPGGTSALRLLIRNNRMYSGNYGIRAQTAVPAFPAGSRFILGEGNDFTSAQGVAIDASAFVAGGGLAIRYPDSQYGNSISNVFTGFTVSTGSNITQTTSKSTAVTLNARRGQVTMVNPALAAGAEVSFTLNDNQILADDCVHVWVKGGIATPGSYRVRCEGSAAGQRTIFVKNETAGSLSEAVIVGFAIV